MTLTVCIVGFFSHFTYFLLRFVLVSSLTEFDFGINAQAFVCKRPMTVLLYGKYKNLFFWGCGIETDPVYSIKTCVNILKKYMIL